MSLQYFCDNPKRQQILRDANIPLNGIDYLEVLDEEAPEETARQRTLLVRMLKPTPWGLTAANIKIEGGVRVTAVNVKWVQRAADASIALSGKDVITEAERDFFRALPEPENVLVVRTDTTGDFSTYWLRLVQSSTNPAPPDGFDPILSRVAFSFKVECPSEFDCQPDDVCPTERVDEPRIDYLAKDYASFRRLMLDRLSITMPDWQERNPADMGVALVEVLAYAADYLSYYQDAAATEAYLGTARRRVSVRRHARLLDYAMHDGCNARTWIHVAVAADLTLARGTQLLSRVAGFLTRIGPDSSEYVQLLAHQPVVFETMHEAGLFTAHNDFEFYTWGDEACCLPRGATRATLRCHFASLKAGDVLIFLEKRGAESGKAADADLTHRHAVRLTDVTLAEDPLGGQILGEGSTDPVPVTEIVWRTEDALPFPLCLWMVEVPAEERDPGAPAEQPVSIVLGNVVLADHGMTIEGEALPIVPSAERYRPSLQRTEITYCTHGRADEDVLQDWPASALVVQDPRQALPAVKLHDNSENWHPQRDLLASDRFATEFVVEMESDRRASLRFGDGLYGRPPTTGTELSATYRVGNGPSGNLGADAIGHVVSSDDGIVAVRNPLPARGGTDAESMEEVRQYAPQAFRTQERAVTAADYVAVAERHPGIQRAIATRRWTGSWYTMFLTVDRQGGLAVDADFESELRTFLERFRLAGQDLEIDGPHFVPLDIAFTVCVEPDHFRSHVKAALLETFSTHEFPDGRHGFFHPDRFTFNQPAYLSQMVAAAMQVPGVRWVDAEVAPSKSNRFKRWGEPQRNEFQHGRIDIGRLEIARLDNDPSMPENGKIEFTMEGGL